MLEHASFPLHSCLIHILSAVEQVPTLELVQIFFDTASFDEIERDEKTNFETQISTIGGTMGLFTGFSIISGIELIFFAAKFFLRSTAIAVPKGNEKKGCL